MREYTMQDQSTGEATRTDTLLPLHTVHGMTDWSAQEFDDIASMHVGESKLYDSGIYIERTR